jgi:hypothetical protein
LKPCDFPWWEYVGLPSSEENPSVAPGDPTQGRPVASTPIIDATTRPTSEPSTADNYSPVSANCEAKFAGEIYSRLITSTLSVAHSRSSPVASTEPRVHTSSQDNVSHEFDQPTTQGEKLLLDLTRSHPESIDIGNAPSGPDSTPALSDRRGHPPAELTSTLQQCDQEALLAHRGQLSVQCRVANCTKWSLSKRSDQWVAPISMLTSADLYRKHFSTVHERKHCCTFSDCKIKPFGLRADLLRHMKAVHKSCKDQYCHINDCRRAFVRRDHLVRHLRSVHGITNHDATGSSDSTSTRVQSPV